VARRLDHRIPWDAAFALSLLKGLQPGSTLVVTRLDRLARSTIDLLTIIKVIADKGCLFKSLADPWCDTTTPRWTIDADSIGGSRRVRT
jgi:hypothetical protein